MVRYCFSFLLMLLTSSCANWSGDASGSSGTVAHFNDVCSDYELTIPISIFGGVFWIPNYYVYSSGSSEKEVPPFVSGCPTYALDGSEDQQSGMIKVGSRSKCKVCEPEDIQDLNGKEIENVRNGGIQVRVIEFIVDERPVESVVIFDERDFLLILEDDSEFWRRSLEELERFRREVESR